MLDFVVLGVTIVIAAALVVREVRLQRDEERERLARARERTLLR